MPWRRKWQPTPVFLPENLVDGSLAGYSPWGHQESDTTELLNSSSRACDVKSWVKARTSSARAYLGDY